MVSDGDVVGAVSTTKRARAKRDVIVANGVGKESLITTCDVVVAGGVVLESVGAIGNIVGTGGVVGEGARTIGDIV